MRPPIPAPGLVPFHDELNTVLVDLQTGLTRSEKLAVTPEQFGAAGDGVTDDTTALLAMITSAGVDGAVRLTPTKTYLQRRPLLPLAGQHWMAHGATIKRANAVSTTTTTSVSSGAGPKSVTVTSATGFQVGDSVALQDGSTTDANPHAILSINGNVLSLSGTFGATFGIGSTLATVYHQIYAVASDVVIEGLTLDGNRAGNAAIQRWETSNSLYISSENGVVRDCRIIDAQADAIYAAGDNVLIDHNWVENAQGNGIHLSATSHAVVTRNRVKNTNLGGSGVGHVDGGIIASNLVGDAYIVGNHVSGALCGIGSWDSADNSRLICTGNLIQSCTNAFEGTVPSGESIRGVLFAQNQVISSGTCTFKQTNNSTPRGTGPNLCLVTQNYFEDTLLALQNVFDTVVASNVMYRSDATSTLLAVTNGDGITVTGNQGHGAANGIVLDNVGTLAVTNNLMRNQANYGINAGGSTWPDSPALIANNVIISGAAATNDWFGIQAANGILVQGNTVQSAKTHNNVTGIYGGLGGASTNGAMILNNMIRLAQGKSIRLKTGSQKNQVLNNITNQSVDDLGSPNSTVSGTVTVL